MKSASLGRGIIIGATVIGLCALALIRLFSVSLRTSRDDSGRIKAELTELTCALENFRGQVGQYPPGSTEYPETVRLFLVAAFPKYHGELPEKCKNLDAASSLVFWLVGMTDKDGKMIGFSADPTNPFDTTNPSRIGPFFSFDPARLRSEGGLPVYVRRGNDSHSDPYVYFRADAKGQYHGAWGKCRPCRASGLGVWVNSTSYQLFSPGKDGKYGCGIEYPSGTDYDAQRHDDMSNFTNGIDLGMDTP